MKTMIAIAAAALCTSAATAQDVGDTSIAFGVSGFGGSVEAAYRIDPSIGVRGAYWGGVSLSYQEDDGETDIEGDVRLGGLALLADYYPTQSGWRISGGVFFSTGEFEASGTENVSGTE